MDTDTLVLVTSVALIALVLGAELLVGAWWVREKEKEAREAQSEEA